MKLSGAKSLILVGLATAGLIGCVKQSKAPEAPARKGAKSSDQCGKPAEETPAPSGGSYGGGAYLADEVKGTWTAVKALLERDCTSCHPQYTEYETVKVLADRL